MATTRTATVRVPLRNGGSTSMYIAGFLDMMRYDGCEVVSWDKETMPGDRGETFVIKLVTANRFTEDRWRSMGIGITVDD